MLKLGVPDTLIKEINTKFSKFLKDFEKKGLLTGEVAIKNFPFIDLVFPDGYRHTEKLQTLGGIDYFFVKILDYGAGSIHIRVSRYSQSSALEVSVERRS